MFAEFAVMASIVTCLSLVSVGILLATYESIAVTADQQGRQRFEEELSEWREEPEPVDGKSPLYIKYLRSQDFVAIALEEQGQTEGEAPDDVPDDEQPPDEANDEPDDSEEEPPGDEDSLDESGANDAEESHDGHGEPEE